MAQKVRITVTPAPCFGPGRYAAEIEVDGNPIAKVHAISFRMDRTARRPVVTIETTTEGTREVEASEIVLEIETYGKRHA